MIEIIRKSFLVVFVLSLASAVEVMAQEKLKGTIIGSSPSVDYSTNEATTTINTPDAAFDGNANTFFASYGESNTWVGLDLGTPHIITRVGWMPRNDKSKGAKRVCLALFEGANTPDFIDAVPLYIVRENGTLKEMSYGNVDVSRGFRYVRYVGPNNARCNVAEVEFYGIEGQGDDSHLWQLTNLPTVCIATEGAVEPYDKEHQLLGMVTTISQNGTRVISDTAKVRLRGNASLLFPKKPYRIKFNNKQRPLADCPAKDKKWCLINNYGDKTLVRNMLAFRVSQYMEMPYTPYCQPVDVIVNGEYKGCYQLADQVEPGKNRVPINKDIAGSFLLEVDAYADTEPENGHFTTRTKIPVTIKFPDSDDITPEEYTDAENDFNILTDVVDKINRGDYESYLQHLDIESFLKHLLIGEYSGNTDTYWSAFMYKNPDDAHWVVCPAWDFDLGFNNDNRNYPLCSREDFLFHSGGSSAGRMWLFVRRIMDEDPASKQRLCNVWTDARLNGFTAESMTAYLDSLEDVLQEAQNLNFTRWPILSSKVHKNPQALGSYEAEVDLVRQYLSDRMAWMDNLIGINEGVNTIENRRGEDSRIFDLQGRQQSSSSTLLPSGLYIRSGKKVLVR